MDGKIIVLDNEYENVSDLLEIIEGACLRQGKKPSERILYYERVEEMLEQTLEMAKKHEEINAFICDNHLSDLMDGDDLIRFLRGQIPYLTSRDLSLLRVDINKIRTSKDLEGLLRGKIKRKDFLELMEEYFPSWEDYREIANYFHLKRENPIATVLFCGHPEGANLIGIEDVEVIRKCEGCEYMVLDFLDRADVFSKEDIKEPLNNHYRLSPNSKRRSYNPLSHHIKTRKKRFWQWLFNK